MEQNPLEQQKNNKISIIREEARKEMEKLFNLNPEELKSKTEEFIVRLDVYQENGLIFDKEKIKKDVIDSIQVKDKEIFISNLMKALEPIFVAKVVQADIFKKIEIKSNIENRDRLINEDGNIRLSEILYAGLSEKYAHIHLAPAYDFMTKEKISDFNLEIKNGLKNLAKLIEPMKNIEKIVATSWLVTPNPNRKKPNRIEELGFTIEGQISEEEKNKYFRNDEKIIYKASIDRKKFDELYLER